MFGKQRIAETKDAIERQKVKFYIMWSPILLVVILAQLYVAMVAHLAENFEKHWLQVLEPKRASYACSLESLYIDLDELDGTL